MVWSQFPQRIALPAKEFETLKVLPQPPAQVKISQPFHVGTLKVSPQSWQLISQPLSLLGT